MKISHEYFFGSDHQVAPTQLLPVTLETQERLDQLNVQQRSAIYETLFNSVQQSVTGSQIALIKDSRGSSLTDAVVFQVPFANRVRPEGDPSALRSYLAGETDGSNINKISWNMLTKHYFLFDTLKSAGYRDSEGRTIPVILRSAPSEDYEASPDSKERGSYARGDFSPIALDLIEFARSKGYEKLFFAGYSLGAIVVPQAVTQASKKGVDVKGAVIAEPAFQKGALATAKAFMNFGHREYSDGPQFTSPEEKTGGWTDESPQLIKDLEQTSGSWIGNITAELAANLAILRGLGNVGSFIKSIDTMYSPMATPTPTTFIYSRHSRLSKGFEKYLSETPAIQAAAEAALAQCIVADGHNSIDDQHGFGENHQYYVDAMTRSILFADV